MFTPGVAIVGSGTSVCAWVSVADLGRVFPRPGDWMTALRLDARLMVGGVGWMAAGIWACCSCTRSSSRIPGPCSVYCSGTRGTSSNPGPCSLKCADWSLLSPGLFVGDVGVGRVGGSV